MHNQKGGILSKLFIIPAGVALMVGFFFLGYYTGKYQSKSGVQSEVVPPLPDIISKNVPKQEDFTFYKTLTDKGNKTISIDLKPRPANEESKVEKKQVASEPRKTNVAESGPKDKRKEAKSEKASVAPTSAGQAAPKQMQAKKEPAASPHAKQRYVIQIASYQEKEPAEDEVRKLKKLGYAAFVASSELPGKGMWYRVRLGSFSNKAAAEKLQKELHAKEGITPIIVAE